MDRAHIVDCEISLKLFRRAFAQESDQEQSARAIVDVVERIAREAFGENGFHIWAQITSKYDKSYVPERPVADEEEPVEEPVEQQSEQEQAS